MERLEPEYKGANFFKIANNIIDKISAFFAVLAGISLAIMALGVALQALSRYFLGKPYGWVLEVSEFLLLIITFLSLAWVYKEKGHVKIDFLAKKLKTKWENILLIFNKIIMIVFLVIILYAGILESTILYKRKILTVTTFAFPKYVMVSFIFLGLFMLLLQVVSKKRP